MAAAILQHDGCWSWWSLPQAVYDSSTGRTFTGCVEAGGAVKLAQYDSKYQVIQQLHVRTLASDDHDAPAVIVLAAGGSNAGKVLAAYSGHALASYSWLSTSVGSILAGTEQQLENGTSTFCTYCQLFQMGDTNQTVYWFHRYGNSSGSYIWRLRYSTDGGSTWGGAFQLWSGSGNAYCRGAMNGANRIDFYVTSVHPNSGNNVLSHFYLSINANGTFSLSQSDGTSIGTYTATGTQVTGATLPLDDSTPTTVSKIVTGASTWNWDAAAYSGTPYVAYATFTTASTTHDTHAYSQASWSGSAWVATSVSNGGSYVPNWLFSAEAEYSGGIALDPNNANSVYVSRANAGAGGGATATRFDLENWTFSGSWSLAATIKSTAANFACRPKSVINGSNQFIFWYGTYTNWSAGFTTDVWDNPPDTLFTSKVSSPTYSSAVVPSGTNAYFLLYEGSSTTLHDVLATYNGSTVGAITWGSDSYGANLSGFNTSGIYGKSDTLAAAFLAGGYPKWIGFLFKSVSSSTNYGFIFSFGNSASNDAVIGVAVNFNGTANLFSGFIRDNGQAHEADPQGTKTACSDGAWHVGELVLDSTSSQSLYLDGVLVQTTSVSMSTQTLNQFSMGLLRRTGLGQAFDGTIGAVVAGWASKPDPYSLYYDLFYGQFAGTRASIAFQSAWAVAAYQPTIGMGVF